MRRIEKGRISPEKILFFRSIFKQEEISYRTAGKKKNEPDIHFVINGWGYCLNMEEKAERMSLRITKRVLMTMEGEEWTTDFATSETQQIKNWLVSFINEQKMKNMFKNEKYVFTEMVLKSSVWAFTIKKYQEMKTEWLKQLGMKTEDELELMIIAKGIRKSGETFQTNGTEVIHFEGKRIRIQVENNKEKICVKIKNLHM